MMWKEEMTEYSVATTPCRLIRLSVDTTGWHARTATWMKLIPMYDRCVLHSRDTTGNSSTTPHARPPPSRVAICMGETKLTTHAKSFLSIEKPPTLLSAASHTGSSVSYVVWIRPSNARDNRGEADAP